MMKKIIFAITMLISVTVLFFAFGSTVTAGNNNDVLFYNYTETETDVEIPGEHEHNYTYTVITPATCTDVGEGRYECECSDFYTEVIPVINHEYKSTVVAATCKTEGYTLYKCSCGDSYKENYVSRSPHDISGDQCSNCDMYILEIGRTTFFTVNDDQASWCVDNNNVVIIDIHRGWSLTAAGFSYYSMAEIKAAEEGFDVVRAYNEYGSELVFEIEVVECTHKEIITINGKEANCTETGLTDGEECLYCDEIISAQEIIPATGHTPGEWKVVYNAYAGNDGLERKKCITCGEVLEERVIAADSSEKTEESTEKPETAYTKGDANGDGKVNAADARIVLRISARLEKMEDFNQPFEVFDVTKDGKVNASDARKILRISARLEN